MARELDDAILTLRTNELDLGLWLMKTEGDPEKVGDIDAVLVSQRNHWFVREVVGMMRRTFARLEVSSRSMYGIIEPGSCFAGSLLEFAFAADRVYMLDDAKVSLRLSEMNFGALPMANGLPRLEARFYESRDQIARLRGCIGRPLSAQEALQLGLVTFAPDELDWTDEVRLAIEGRSALSPDALTGLEANLRFGGHETMQTRIFGRLSAWQNWIFIRPNAVGPTGALKVYGTGFRAKFDWGRV
jgi:benzoyl-CoA-dihydrodiol lyase